MKGLICYYSSTGNTRLACRYIAKRIGSTFDLFDVVADGECDANSYDALGFACSTDFWGLPRAFESFVEKLPRDDGKPVFVLNTFGALSGKTLRILGEAVAAKGFKVVAGYSLRMPENYPPMIAKGMGASEAPSARELLAFDTFISEAALRLEGKVRTRGSVKAATRIGILNSLFPLRPRTAARKDMGKKFIDYSSCTECGACARSCPYDAIRLEPKPLFDMDKCYGCWSCYNRCPAYAISTAKYREGPYYPGPSEMLKAKLSL